MVTVYADYLFNQADKRATSDKFSLTGLWVDYIIYTCFPLTKFGSAYEMSISPSKNLPILNGVTYIPKNWATLSAKSGLEFPLIKTTFE